MPALDLTTWQAPLREAPPAAAPPASSPTTSTTRPVRAGAPRATTTEAARGGSFGELVDRLADTGDASDEVKAPISRGAHQYQTSARREDVATEPRAKDDTDPAQAPVNDPATPAAPQQPLPFPWTLPLNPALWTLETTPGDDGDAPTTDSAQAVDATAVAGLSASTSASTSGAEAAVTTPMQIAAAATAPASASQTAFVPSTGIDGDAAPVTGVRIAVEQDGSIDTDRCMAPEMYVAASIESDVDATATFASTAVAGRESTPTNQTQKAVTTKADMLSVSASLEAKGAAAAIAASDDTATSGAVTLDWNETTTEDNAAGAATAPATEGSAATATQAGSQTDVTAGTAVDQARRQASHELRRAIERARTSVTSSTETQSRQADGTIDVNTTAAADASAVTTRDSAIGARAGVHADVTVAAQTRDMGPRASGRATEAAAAEANAWLGAATSVTTVNDASTGSTDSSGRGRDSHADTFGAIVSALRPASDGGANGLPSAFDARALMATALDSASRSHEAAANASASAIVTTAPPEEQVQQIVRSMRLQWRGSVGEAQLRLQPEHLGQVLVHVRVDQGSVTASMHAETPAAHQWIQAHQQQLRDALDAQGLRVTQLHVTSDPEDRPRREQQPRRDRGQERSRKADDRRFEIQM